LLKLRSLVLKVRSLFLQAVARGGHGCESKIATRFGFRLDKPVAQANNSHSAFQTRRLK
jgi:hypothetical protein